MIIGIIIMAFGVLLLLHNLEIISYDIWSIFLPVIIIAIGIKLAARNRPCCAVKEEQSE